MIQYLLNKWFVLMVLVLIPFGYIYKRFLSTKVFAFILNKLTKKTKRHFHNAKEQIFQEAFDGVRMTKGDRLKILEIGVGTGSNFSYYPKNSQVTILDKSDVYLSYVKESLKNDRQDDVIVDDLVIGRGENLSGCESNKFDGVVATLVMCSVENPSKVFEEIYRILKPGGAFIFLDHSMNMENVLIRFIQVLIQPVWSFFFDDCKFVDINGLIKACPKFKDAKVLKHKSSSKKTFPSIMEPVYYGLIRKEI